MNLPPKAMMNKLDPNFILFVKATSFKFVMSCYPCFKTSKSQPSKKVEKHNT